MFWGQKHPVSDDQLSAYSDARVDADERSRIAAHLETCAPCREALAELAALRRALSTMPRAVGARAFTLRPSDVARPARPAGAGPLAPLMPMLSGVTMAAFVAFAVLVGVDMSDSGGGSDETVASAGFISGGQDRSPAPGVGVPENDAGAESTDDLYPPDAVTPPVRDATSDGENGLQLLTATAYAGAYGRYTVVPSATPPQPKAQAADDGGSGDTALRAGQIATAALALTAGGSLAMVWWRRRV